MRKMCTKHLLEVGGNDEPFPISGTNAMSSFLPLYIHQPTKIVTAASIPCSFQAPDVWREGVFDLTKTCPSQARLLVVDWTEGLDDEPFRKDTFPIRRKFLKRLKKPLTR